jgi:hypothetical protein
MDTRTQLPDNDFTATPEHTVSSVPGYGGPQRDAINACVDDVVDRLCNRIAALRLTLEKLQQQALESAAEAKQSLCDHVVVCARVNDEVSHMEGVIDEISASFR